MSAIALDPANNKLYVSNRDGDTGAAYVWVINTTTNLVVDQVPGAGANSGNDPIILPGSFFAAGLAVRTSGNPADNRLYVTTRNAASNATAGLVWVINTSNDTLVDQVSGGGIDPITVPPNAAGVAAKGDRLYVASTNGTVSVIDLANNNAITPISLPGGVTALFVAISPDGTKAYVTASGGMVYVINIVPAI